MGPLMSVYVSIKSEGKMKWGERLDERGRAETGSKY